MESEPSIGRTDRRECGCGSDSADGRKTHGLEEAAAVNRRSFSPLRQDGQAPQPPETVTTPAARLRVGRFPLAGETEKREYESVGPLGPGESGNDWKFITNRCQRGSARGKPLEMPRT